MQQENILKKNTYKIVALLFKFLLFNPDSYIGKMHVGDGDCHGDGDIDGDGYGYGYGDGDCDGDGDGKDYVSALVQCTATMKW